MEQTERLTITRGENHLVTLVGELDAYTAKTLEPELLDGEVSSDLRLDLSRVSFIDSTGLRTIVAADNELQGRGHRVVILEPSRSVRRLLELTALDEHLQVEGSK